MEDLGISRISERRGKLGNQPLGSHLLSQMKNMFIPYFTLLCIHFKKVTAKGYKTNAGGCSLQHHCDEK